MKNILCAFVIIISFCVLYDPELAHAELTSGGVLNEVLVKYQTATKSWGEKIQDRATWLFMALTTISMVWTFSQLLFHRSSLAELFGELIRFMMFTGFFLWLLREGPKMAMAIIDSFKKIGAEASTPGTPGNFTPSSLVDIGFKIVDKVCDQSSMWSPVISAGCIILSCIILVILALIGINMLLMLCSAWVLAYAGVFFLGFGGSKWTSDMAINYFKTVLGLGASLMTMILLVGVGTGLIHEYSSRMTTTGIKLQELAVLLVASITLLLLVDKLPAMVSGIITGASIGSSGGGSFGAGAAVGAAMTAGSAAMGAASFGGRVAMAGAANVAGVASALNAAWKASSGSGGETRDSFGMSASMGNRSSMAAEIGKGLAGMGKQAMDNAKQGFAERSQNTMGGKLADTIKNSGNSGNQGGGQ